MGQKNNPPVEKIPSDRPYGGFEIHKLSCTVKDKTLDSFTTIPADAEAPLPGIILIHGGPGAASHFPDRDKRPPMATARGILNAKTLRKHLCRKFVITSAEFVSDFPGDQAALKWIEKAYENTASHPLVDENRIGCIGVSHGGYLALMSAVKPGIELNYNALVAVSPFTDVRLLLRYWHSLQTKGPGLGTATAYGLKKAKQALGWPPKKDRGTIHRYRKVSVLSRLDRLEAPLLLVHGMDDRVVPRRHSYLAAKALRECGKNVRLVSPKGEKNGGHFLFGLNDDVWVEIGSFFSRFM